MRKVSVRIGKQKKRDEEDRRGEERKEGIKGRERGVERKGN